MPVVMTTMLLQHAYGKPSQSTAGLHYQKQRGIAAQASFKAYAQALVR